MGWAESLRRETLPEAEKEIYRGVIRQFLGHCRGTGQGVTVASARAFMEEARLAGEVPSGAEAGWKAGLHWYFRAARHPKEAARCGVPPLAAGDWGRTDWEKRLIERLRVLHYQWRTEQTYRGWAWRLARYLEPRPVAEAGGQELGEFLTWLATTQRVSAATQRQALNALVFL